MYEMPKAKMKSYSREAVADALTAIKEGRMTYQKAECIYGIPKSTLFGIVKNNSQLEKVSPPRDPVHLGHIPSVFPFNDSQNQSLAVTEWHLEKQMGLAVWLSQPQKVEHEIKEFLTPKVELRELEEPQTQLNHCGVGSTICPHYISFIEEKSKNHKLIIENESLRMELEDLKRMVSINTDTFNFVDVKEEPEEQRHN